MQAPPNPQPTYMSRTADGYGEKIIPHTGEAFPDLVESGLITPDSPNPLYGIMEIDRWLDGPGGMTFDSRKAFDNFRREHLHELVSGGGLVLKSGRRPEFATKLLAGLVMRILLRESIKRLNDVGSTA